MIREDIKIKLMNKDVDKLFLPHRDEIDQANYRVGNIDNEIIAWNPINNLFMDYFYDDYLEIIWFDISFLDKRISGLGLKMNRNGICINSAGKTLKQQHLGNYPEYIINISNNNKRITYSFRIHRALAKLFIPQYDINKNYVDHINRDKEDYSISNLRWASVTENNHNKSESKEKDRVYVAYEDSDRDIEKFRINFSELRQKFSAGASTKIYKSINNNTKYLGYYWEVIDANLNNYLKSINANSVDNSLWVKHYLGFYVHPLGLVKRKKNSPVITPGNRSDGIKYFKYGNRLVHRLIVEAFLNNNKPLLPNHEIDHINSNPLDNRVENLSICTSHSQNMSNINTISKFSRKVIDNNGKIYLSIVECAKQHGVSDTTIVRRITGVSKNNPDGFRFYDEVNDQNKQP